MTLKIYSSRCTGSGLMYADPEHRLKILTNGKINQRKFMGNDRTKKVPKRSGQTLNNTFFFRPSKVPLLLERRGTGGASMTTPAPGAGSCRRGYGCLVHENSQTGQMHRMHGHSSQMRRMLTATCRSPQQRQPQAASMMPVATATANTTAMVGPQSNKRKVENKYQHLNRFAKIK